jgi:hypothetical protein
MKTLTKISERIYDYTITKIAIVFVVIYTFRIQWALADSGVAAFGSGNPDMLMDMYASTPTYQRIFNLIRYGLNRTDREKAPLK